MSQHCCTIQTQKQVRIRTQMRDLFSSLKHGQCCQNLISEKNMIYRGADYQDMLVPMKISQFQILMRLRDIPRKGTTLQWCNIKPAAIGKI